MFFVIIKCNLKFSYPFVRQQLLIGFKNTIFFSIKKQAKTMLSKLLQLNPIINNQNTFQFHTFNNPFI
ncbi:MAG: hypothetical protein B7Y83_12190 [Flavobacteriales bacterium 32-34-25]|nr:MAG: hypothetical protein B7Y83_12190 [Flavobacteriales bacterium 32-34-25]